MQHAASKGFVLRASGGMLLVGVLIGMLISGSLPVGAAVGDTAIVGAVNSSGGQQTTFKGGGTGGVLRVRNTNSNPALDLRVAGGPPMVVDSTKRVKKLNADRVDGFHANELVRASYASSFNVADANGTAVSTTIEAPAPGILVMGASIEAFGSTYDSWGCRLQVGTDTVAGSSMFSTVNTEEGGHTRNYNEDCSTDGAVAVDAGSHTVSLDIYLRETVGLFEAALWVIYVPFDGAGNRVSIGVDDVATTGLPPDRTDMVPGG